jgi:hypothetical protein
MKPAGGAAASGRPEAEIVDKLRDDHGVAVSLDNFIPSDAPARDP